MYLPTFSVSQIYFTPMVLNRLVAVYPSRNVSPMLGRRVRPKELHIIMASLLPSNTISSNFPGKRGNGKCFSLPVMSIPSIVWAQGIIPCALNLAHIRIFWGGFIKCGIFTPKPHSPRKVTLAWVDFLKSLYFYLYQGMTMYSSQ